MKILLVDDQQPVREMMRLCLEACTDGQIFEAGSAEQAIKLIKNVTDFGAVICDYAMPGGNGDLVHSHLIHHRSRTPFVLCSASPSTDFEIFRQNPPYFEISKKKLFEGLEQFCKVFQLRSPPANRIPFKLRTLEFLGKAPVDLYSELNDQKALKVVLAGDRFDALDAERFRNKGLHSLFANRTEVRTAIHDVLKSLHLQAQADALHFCRSLGMTTEAIELVSQLNEQIGMTPEVQTLVLECLEQTMQALQVQPELGAYEQHFKMSAENHLARHSQLLAYVTGQLYSMLSGASERKLKTIALSALLHDLPLNSDVMSQYQSVEELKKHHPQATPEEIRRFEQHPVQAAMLCDYFGIDPDLDLILARELIVEHHGTPNGKPPSRESALFQLCELWLHHQNQAGRSTTWNEFTQSLPPRIQQGPTFKELIPEVSLAILGRAPL